MCERAIATLGLIMLATMACDERGDATKREVVLQAVPGVCNGPDSLIFSDVEISPEDEDLSGLEIVLHRRDGVWTGSSREAAGEFGPFVPLSNVNGDSVPGSISFSFPRERDTTLFAGQIYCDSLVGEVRLNRIMLIRRVAYARIEASGKPILAKLPSETATPSEKGFSGPPAEYRDSADVFDPDGYYIMKEDLTIHGRQIGWLDLRTIDFYYDGQLHYERPKLVQPPMVGISLSEFNDANHHSRHLCTAPLITPDSLWVRCVNTPVGDVTLRGHFLDKAGWYWNKLTYENHPTVLLIARVVVTRDGRVIHDAVHRFTYSGGD